MSRKRKASSLSVQLNESHESTSPTPNINLAMYQPPSVSEGTMKSERKRSRDDSLDEGPQNKRRKEENDFMMTRKRRRNDSFDEGSESKRMKEENDPMMTRKRKRDASLDGGLESKRRRSDEELEKKKSPEESSSVRSSAGQAPPSSDIQQDPTPSDQAHSSSASSDSNKGGFFQRGILKKYEVGRFLGRGAFGMVLDGLRLEDGLQVAVKIARKTHSTKYITIPDHPSPVPLEIGLLMLANKAPKTPEIIELLEWEDLPESYIMIMQNPSPCENLRELMDFAAEPMYENLARIVMRQVVSAAHGCCVHGVLHRDIKFENLLLNTGTLRIKLIDFGCGERLTNSTYDHFSGTRRYCPPEFIRTKKYRGKSSTVWSLGVLFFAMVVGHYPDCDDLQEIEDGVWFVPGLSKDCHRLIRSLLRQEPRRRIGLGNILSHRWFKDAYPHACSDCRLCATNGEKCTEHG